MQEWVINAKREADSISEQHKNTWIYNTEYTNTFTCELCKQEMNVKFHKNGMHMNNTRLYKERIEHGGIVLYH